MENLKKNSYCLLVVFLFLLGIFLRTKLYITNNVFEDDECRLAITMLGKSFGQMFLPLGYAQSAPPIFMFFSKLLAEVFGYREIVLKFIPFVSSLIGIPLFYLLCKDYFFFFLSIILCLFLFILNHNFIVYSSVFKQYSTDILFSILCLCILPKINVIKLSTKKYCLLIISLILLPFISLPSVFFIAAFWIINIIDNFKNKEFYKRLLCFLIPFILIMLLYFFFNLLPSKINMDEIFPNYWIEGFCSLIPTDILRLIIYNLKFGFIPNDLTLFQLILLISGIIICISDKSKTRNISIFILLTLLFAFLTSVMHLYPLLGRVGLFITPLFLLIVVTPFDRIKSSKVIPVLLTICFVLSYYKYIPYFNSYNAYEIGYSPKTLMQILKENFNTEEDIILCNPASSASFVFYSSKYNLNADRVYEMNFKTTDELGVFEYFNNLAKNQKYWLYLIKDYNRAQVFPYVNKWLESKKILYYKKEKNSYLIYFEN